MTTQTREQPNTPESGVGNGGSMKNYEVKYVCVCHVVVQQAEDEHAALDAAADRVSFGDCQMLEGSAMEIPDNRLESYIRHADVVVEPAE